ncbi:MAG: zinc ribbon domain-containing protein [Gemmatimonadaceae bacterium]
MPTYEFTCPNGHDFDKFFRSMASAPTVVPCPVCGKPADRQMSAGAGLVFHGTGFYITDYGKDGKKDQKPAPHRHSESTHGSESESKHGSDSESKHGSDSESKHSSDSESQSSAGESSSHAADTSGSAGASDSMASGSSSEPATKSSPDKSSAASVAATKPAAAPKATE